MKIQKVHFLAERPWRGRPATKCGLPPEFASATYDHTENRIYYHGKKRKELKLGDPLCLTCLVKTLPVGSPSPSSRGSRLAMLSGFPRVKTGRYNPAA